ncbi:TNT domain-containing protein [Streptomyces sp. ODS05-4]|uniref:TNT domain-containing protein n=1 Tax=Streptomyces sp. ODS05-4 TaxID=2944939 RepID=UPI00210C1FD1|nr:TNT domain-containing protein [Streptomyces sp. ODS05-4]
MKRHRMRVSLAVLGVISGVSFAAPVAHAAPLEGDDPPTTVTVQQSGGAGRQSPAGETADDTSAALKAAVEKAVEEKAALRQGAGDETGDEKADRLTAVVEEAVEAASQKAADEKAAGLRVGRPQPAGQSWADVRKALGEVAEQKWTELKTALSDLATALGQVVDAKWTALKALFEQPAPALPAAPKPAEEKAADRSAALEKAVGQDAPVEKSIDQKFADKAQKPPVHDKRLGPDKLPRDHEVLGPLLNGYKRTGGMPRKCFLKEYWDGDRDQGCWKYPPHEGFEVVNGKPDIRPTTLQPGTYLDRFGGETGQYLTPEGDAYGKRALPPQNLNPWGCDDPASCYHVYKVLKPFQAWQGPIAPWFGQPGGGQQIKLDGRFQNVGSPVVNVKWLIDNGYLARASK